MAEPWYRLAFGPFYPALYAHRDDDEARRCVDLLRRLAPLDGGRGLPVLDLGCGDGRHLPFLRQAGLPAIGLDLSPWLLRVAADRAAGAPLVRGDMRFLPLGGGSCGAVLSLFTAFGYFGRDGDGAMARAIGRALTPGGHWCLDYLDADRVRAELADGPRERARDAGPLAVRETRGLDVSARAVIKDVTMQALAGREAEADAMGVGPAGLRYREQVALYSLEELDRLAASGGMARIAAAGDYDGAPLGAGSRWLLVYRKVAES